MNQKSDKKTCSTTQGAFSVLLAVLLFVTAFASPRPVHAAPQETCQNCVFLPMLSRPGTGVDLVLTGVEMTQAIQDKENSIPLIAGRATMLRIYAVALGPEQPLENIDITVSIANDATGLSSLAHSMSATLPLYENRADFASSVNIRLPDHLLNGAFTLTVRVDPENLLAEDDETNNIITRRFEFQAVPALRIKVVPVAYTHAPTGRTFDAPTTDTISDWIRRTYPVDRIELSWHAPFTFTGDLRQVSQFEQLLFDITSLKMLEGEPDDVIYYGLIAPRDASASWFTGGVAGIGWVGLRAAVGLDLADRGSLIAAHEIGHNLGLQHSPCGVTGDPNYPYPNGSIGNFGLDVKTGSVYLPTSSKDLMSYCTPRWISDYTYQALLKAQLQFLPEQVQQSAGLRVQARSTALLVRAQVNEAGARLLPAYVLPDVPTPATVAGDYEVQLLDPHGSLVASVPAQAFTTGDEFPSSGLQVMVPLPDAPVTRVRLLKAGHLLAEQALQSSAPTLARDVRTQPAAPSTSSTLGAQSTVGAQSAFGAQLTWGSASTANAPAGLLRYSLDGGQTWTVLAMDVVSGQANLPAGLLANPNASFQVVLAAQ